MAIEFNCSNPACQRHIAVDVSEAVHIVKCPYCGKFEQVPGSPAKPDFHGQLPQTKAEKHIPPASRVAHWVLSLTPFKRLLLGWGLGAALFTLLIAGQQLRLPWHFNAMAREISSIGAFRVAPLVNHSGTKLIYARETEDGIGLFLMNLATRQCHLVGAVDRAVSIPDNSFKLIGWSPDDSRLAFAVDSKQDQTITICDGDSGALQKTFPLCDNAKQKDFSMLDEVKEAVWLTGDSLLLMDSFHSLYLLNIKTSRMEELHGYTSLNGSPPYALARMSDHGIAYVDDGNVWSLDISTRQTQQLTCLTNATIEWLDYSPAKMAFLFCLTEPGSKRSLYQFDLNTTNLTRLTDTDTLKGQWIDGDTGIAYVGMANNSTYFLAIKPRYNALRTNLFGEHILAYSVAPRKDKVYAFAAIDQEPFSLWEYDIASQNLRNVVSGTNQPFVFSKIIPRSYGVAVKDNVPYYILTPPKMKARKKYPVVIDQPSAPYYDSGSQFLANAGIIYVSIYRDGPEPILAVYDQLLKNRNVDPHRIYLAGLSLRTAVVAGLVDEHPGLLRGVILLSPVAFPRIQDNVKDFPSIFISIGDEDFKQSQNATERFARDACRQLIGTKIIHHSNATHILNSTKLERERYEAVAKFILTDY